MAVHAKKDLALEAEARAAAEPQITRGAEIAEKFSPFSELEQLVIEEGSLASPAKRLQHYLDTELGSQFGEDVMAGQWSARRTILFVGFASTFLWGMIIMMLKAIL